MKFNIKFKERIFTFRKDNKKSYIEEKLLCSLNSEEKFLLDLENYTLIAPDSMGLEIGDFDKIKEKGEELLKEYEKLRKGLYSVTVEADSVAFKITPFIMDSHGNTYKDHYQIESVKGKPFFKELNEDNLYRLDSDGTLMNEYDFLMNEVSYKKSIYYHNSIFDFDENYQIDNFLENYPEAQDKYYEAIEDIKKDKNSTHQYLISKIRPNYVLCTCPRCTQQHSLSQEEFLSKKKIHCICGRVLVPKNADIQTKGTYSYHEDISIDHDDCDWLDIIEGTYDDVVDAIINNIHITKRSFVMKKYDDGAYYGIF